MALNVRATSSPPPEAADVREAVRGRWPEVLAALAPELGEAIDRGFRRHSPCPVHGGKDGLRVFPDFEDTGGVVCNTCGQFADGFAALMWLRRWDFPTTLANVAGIIGMGTNRTGAQMRTSTPDKAASPVTPDSTATAGEAAQRRDRLDHTWDLATPDTGRIADYLRSRGLSGRVPAGLRLHPILDYWTADDPPKKEGTYPAMLAQVTDAAGLVVTLHRTYLDPDGHGKASVASPKKSMPPLTQGAMTGAAIRLFDPTDVLAVTEGIETALAVEEATGTPVWAAVSAGGLEAVELPPTVRRVEIWADGDESGRGQDAAEKAAARLQAEGRELKVLLPPQAGRDWLNVLVNDGAKVLKDAQAAALPWQPEPVADADPVDLAELLDAVRAFLKRFIVFATDAQSVAVALWVAHTYVFEQADVSPYLAVTSPEKRCGKTRVFEVLELTVARPWRAVDPSPAVLYRKIEDQHPTLLFDETDGIFGASGRQTGDRNDELRAVLNAGHRRGTIVTRCGGGNKDILQDFNMYTPKAFAGIGQLPDTVADRSIVIRMARKASAESVERFRRKKAVASGHALRDRLADWAKTAELPDEPDLPDELDDRAQDNWEPLLAVADLAGGEWPKRARQAALVLSAGRTDATESLGVRLLLDVRIVFDEAGLDRLKTKELLGSLAALEESPWGTFHDGNPMRPVKLANLLRPYGVRPGDHRFGDKTAKGYLRDDFGDAWSRYLEPAASPETQRKGQQGQHACKSVENEGQQGAPNATSVAPEKPLVCRDVAPVAPGGPISGLGPVTDSDEDADRELFAVTRDDVGKRMVTL